MDANALNTAFPKDLLYLRQVSSKRHKDFQQCWISRPPQIHTAVPALSEHAIFYRYTQIFEGLIKKISSEEKRNAYKQSQKERQRKLS
jgi:hypothetical protein